ncbi:MAG: type II toxin-antitoxin system RelE/ParE family toxin [Balneolaceae bacterium]|nr:MAG: type II toxin-antitoxin system RelE/ParE family toxin [Balneolaceae bacterium]
MKIIWSPTARTKTKKNLDYISEDNPDAALALIDQFETKV